MLFYLFSFLFFLAPLYVWRFSVLNINLNFLLIYSAAVSCIFIVWLLKEKQLPNFWHYIKAQPVALLLGLALLFFSATIGLFNFGFSIEKFGQWLVLFILPISVFFGFGFYLTHFNTFPKEKVYKIIILFLGVCGVLSALQYFGLYFLPAGYWGNSIEPKRAVSFFAHPNGFGLFVAPLLALTLPFVFSLLQSLKKHWSWLVMWLLGVFGLFLSLSRGAVLGLLAAAGIFVLIKGGKKLWVASILIIFILAVIIFSVPNLRYRAILPFKGEKSSVARFSLWHTGVKAIKDYPVFGLGVIGFSNNWDKYNSDPNLEHYNYPHNIFLNFAVDYGLVGLLGFFIVILCTLWYSYQYRRKLWALSTCLFLVAFLVHGQIDIPYLKNDLALIFWLVLAIFYSKIFLTHEHNTKNQNV